MTNRLLSSERLPDYGIVIGDKQRKRLEAVGKFPRRVQATARSHAYVEAEILEFAGQCIAARTGAEAA